MVSGHVDYPMVAALPGALVKAGYTFTMRNMFDTTGGVKKYINEPLITMLLNYFG